MLYIQKARKGWRLHALMRYDDVIEKLLSIGTRYHLPSKLSHFSHGLFFSQDRSQYVTANAVIIDHYAIRIQFHIFG